MKVHELIKILGGLPSNLDILIEQNKSYTKKIQVYVGHVYYKPSDSNEEVLFIERKKGIPSIKYGGRR